MSVLELLFTDWHTNEQAYWETLIIFTVHFTLYCFDQSFNLFYVGSIEFDRNIYLKLDYFSENCKRCLTILYNFQGIISAAIQLTLTLKLNKLLLLKFAQDCASECTCSLLCGSSLLCYIISPKYSEENRNIHKWNMEIYAEGKYDMIHLKLYFICVTLGKSLKTLLNTDY